MRSLEETLRYQHDGVIEKLQSGYGLDAAEAADLFLEARRWLWLQAKSREDLRQGRPAPRNMPITASLTMLDEAWHTFILFTRDYHDFCRDYLGAYIHHLPNAGQHADHDMDVRAVLAEMMEYVHDQLGRDTLIKWYAEYHDRYADVEIRFELRRGKSVPSSRPEHEGEAAVS